MKSTGMLFYYIPVSVMRALIYKEFFKFLVVKIINTFPFPLRVAAVFI